MYRLRHSKNLHILYERRCFNISYSIYAFLRVFLLCGYRFSRLPLFDFPNTAFWLYLIMTTQATPGVDLNDNLGPQIAHITVAMAVLAGIALVGRLICRRMLKLQLTISDYLIVAGLLGVWVYSGLIIGGNSNSIQALQCTHLL